MENNWSEINWRIDFQEKRTRVFFCVEQATSKFKSQPTHFTKNLKERKDYPVLLFVNGNDNDEKEWEKMVK